VFDDTARYGSAGRLLGVNALDTYDRGLLGNVVTHELLHQWVAYITPAFGLSDGIHFMARSSVASLVGGFRWIEQPGGGFVLDCGEGRSGAHHAAPLDRYMMGLIDAAAVPPLHVSTGSQYACGAPIDGIPLTITTADIQAVHGVRSPGPAEARRAFALAFVAESHARRLDADEMTFYETLAAHYTAPIPPDQPDPYHGSGQWASVTRFFGEGTTWRSDVTTCGNRTVEGDEECDDGNTAPGDGCSADCRRETGEVVIPVGLGSLAPVNPHSNRPITLVLLGAEGFAAASVDLRTVRFGPTGTEAAPTGAALNDVNADGRADLTLRFRTRDTAAACGDTALILTGRTDSGRPFQGSGPLELQGLGSRSPPDATPRVRSVGASGSERSPRTCPAPPRGFAAAPRSSRQRRSSRRPSRAACSMSFSV
jgi:cysteine-rich repeat protein